LIIWLFFFPYLQTKPCFCRLFARPQLDFSAIPVSISAVSLRKLTPYILLDFKVAKWAVPSLTLCSNAFQVNMFISRFTIQILHTIQNLQEGKKHQKTETSNFKLPNLCGNQLIST
jgi:hypothetical protein